MTDAGIPDGYVLDPPPAGGQAPPPGYVLDPPPKEYDPGAAITGALGVGQGLTFGFGPRILAGIETGGGLFGDYGAKESQLQQAYDQARTAHPIASIAGEIAGSIVSPVSKIGAAAKGVGLGARMLGGARQGLIGGGLWGASQSPDLTDVGQTAESALSGAIPGAVLGAALGAPGRKAAQAGATRGSEVAAAGERLGVQVPTAVASDNPIVQGGAAKLQSMPFTGALRKSAVTAIDQLGTAATDVASGYSPGATAESAGSAARSALTNYIGPVTKSKVSQLYDKVDNFVDPKITTPLQNTAQIATDIMRSRNAAALPESGAVKQIMGAISRPGGLGYSGIKFLRTSVGEMLDHGILPPDISGTELKRIYGGLTDDLQASAINAGGKPAADAFKRANTYARLVAGRRENLARLLGAPNDEGVFAAILQKASGSSTADAKLLLQARKAMPLDEWNKVASAAIAKLGRDSEGNFSPALWLGRSGYAALSPAGKNTLFRSVGNGRLADSLDDIATISSRFKQLQAMANSSKTAPHVIMAAAAGNMIRDPITTTAALLGANFTARLLAKPATARGLATWSKAYSLAVTKPSNAALVGFQAASKQLAATIGREFGIGEHVGDIAQALAGAVSPTQPSQGQQ